MSSRLYKKKPTLCASCGAYNEAEKKVCSFCRQPLAYEESETAVVLPPVYIPKETTPQKRMIPAYYHVQDEFFYPPPFWNKRRRRARRIWQMKRIGAGVLLVIMIGGAVFAIKAQLDSRDNKAWESALSLYESGNDDAGQQALKKFISDYPQSPFVKKAEERLAAIKMSNLNEKIENIFNEKIYSVQMTDIEILLSDHPDLPKEIRDKLNKRKDLLEKKLKIYKNSLEEAKNYLNKEYYTAAIRILYPLVQEGDKVGNLHKDAQELFYKTHVKKIRFYFVRGNLKKARQAIIDAKKMGVTNEQLTEFSTKIKGLETAAPSTNPR